MYNGIGLATARGSGTNAYVQKNLSFTNKLKQKVEYKTEEDIRKLEATVNRPANQAILAHQRKRQIELKCLEMREKMEEEGYSEEEIGKKVAAHRETLTAKAEEAARMKEMLFKFDENGRPFVKETHQMAEINQERNDKLKRALGINDNFVEGSSLDIDRRSKEIVEKTEPNDHQIRDNTFSPVLSTKSHSKKIVEYNETKEVDTQKTEKNKEKKIEQKHRESDNEMPVKDIPKKYAYDDRKRSKRSRSRDKHTSKKDQSRSQKSDRHYSRSKRSRRDRDSNSSSSSRERKSRRSTRQTRRSRSPSSSSSSSSSISSSSSPSRRRSSSSSSSRMSSRSPPIRRRRGSPNFLEKRRITSVFVCEECMKVVRIGVYMTEQNYQCFFPYECLHKGGFNEKSARKRPVPYHRRSPSYDSDSLFSASSNDSSFSSLSTISRKRCDWRRSSHKSISNSLTEIT